MPETRNLCAQLQFLNRGSDLAQRKSPRHWLTREFVMKILASTVDNLPFRW